MERIKKCCFNAVVKLSDAGMRNVGNVTIHLMISNILHYLCANVTYVLVYSGPDNVVSRVCFTFLTLMFFFPPPQKKKKHKYS